MHAFKGSQRRIKRQKRRLPKKSHTAGHSIPPPPFVDISGILRVFFIDMYQKSSNQESRKHEI